VLAFELGSLGAAAVGALEPSLLLYPTYYCLVNGGFALLTSVRRAARRAGWRTAAAAPEQSMRMTAPSGCLVNGATNPPPPRSRRRRPRREVAAQWDTNQGGPATDIAASAAMAARISAMTRFDDSVLPSAGYGHRSRP
jgi:hypothetical protein